MVSFLLTSTGKLLPKSKLKNLRDALHRHHGGMLHLDCGDCGRDVWSTICNAKGRC